MSAMSMVFLMGMVRVRVRVRVRDSGVDTPARVGSGLSRHRKRLTANIPVENHVSISHEFAIDSCVCRRHASVMEIGCERGWPRRTWGACGTGRVHGGETAHLERLGALRHLGHRSGHELQFRGRRGALPVGRLLLLQSGLHGGLLWQLLAVSISLMGYTYLY